MVGLDRGSKYCTIRDRESEYALATATPTEASTMKSAPDAAVLPVWFRGFQGGSGSVLADHIQLVFSGGMYLCDVPIFDGIFRGYEVSRAHESREVVCGCMEV